MLDPPPQPINERRVRPFRMLREELKDDCAADSSDSTLSRRQMIVRAYVCVFVQSNIYGTFVAGINLSLYGANVVSSRFLFGREILSMRDR